MSGSGARKQARLRRREPPRLQRLVFVLRAPAASAPQVILLDALRRHCQITEALAARAGSQRFTRHARRRLRCSSAAPRSTRQRSRRHEAIAAWAGLPPMAICCSTAATYGGPAGNAFVTAARLPAPTSPRRRRTGAARLGGDWDLSDDRGDRDALAARVEATGPAATAQTLD
jgi:hypothetical protein